MGGRPLYIITRHVLPQTATYGIIAATLAIPGFILAEAVLSFIGLGIQQLDVSWGNMLTLATNASILVLQPWLVWPPVSAGEETSSLRFTGLGIRSYPTRIGIRPRPSLDPSAPPKDRLLRLTLGTGRRYASQVSTRLWRVLSLSLKS